MSTYLIADRSGVVLEAVQHVVDGNGVPTGTRGLFGWKRTSGDVTNVDSWRFLLT